jgi:hypothetical protein
MAKAKGTTLISMVKFLRSQRERAMAVLPESMHGYLDQRIHASSWYPEADLLELLKAMLQLVPGSREANLQRMGAAIAREHMEGVYEHLKAHEPTSFARRAATLWGSQHDSGAPTVTIEAPGRARYEIRGYGHPSREMCAIVEAYFVETLRMAGWADVRAAKEACVNDRADVCRWTITWRERA